MEIVVTKMKSAFVGKARMEIVERKGVGHPDSLCDGVAEALSIALSRHYVEHFGRILHHNVDKVALVGGDSRASFGEGKVTHPLRVIFIGRATGQVGKVKIPVKEIALQTGREFFRGVLPNLDVDRDLKIDVLLRPGSADLVANYERDGLPASNDTSFGIGYAPFSETEQATLRAEAYLNSPKTKKRHPEWGEDVKVMGTRVGDHLNLTVALAFVAKYVPDMDFYVASRTAAAAEVRAEVQKRTSLKVDVDVNRADVDATGSVYLTATGTSAECGDDGQVGRGNRPNGIITPYRPMTLEAAAGKNPTTHVGKIYNLAAWDIAAKLAKKEGIDAVHVYLVSAIGSPVNQPRALEMRVLSKLPAKEIEEAGRKVAAGVLKAMPDLWKKLLSGKHRVC